VWRSGERLLVAVGPSPFSTQLVRWTRRLAGALGAPWVALYVEPAKPLSKESQRLLDKNLALARELGAEVVVTHDNDVAAALVRVALLQNATQIVVGKTRGHGLLDTLRGGTLVDRLLQLGGAIDICVVPGEERRKHRFRPDWAIQSSSREYVTALATMAAVTLASWFLVDLVGYRSVGQIYLLVVVVLGLCIGRGPVLFAGVLGALVWDYFFIPPRFTFVIGSLEDVMVFAATIAVALVAGQLTSRVRAQGRNERLREERATALFHLTRALAEAKTLDDAVFAALRQADELFSVKTCLALANEDAGGLAPHFAGSYPIDERERGVAEWVYLNRRRAGRFTDTLPASIGYYVPLVREDRAVGVLGVKAEEGSDLTLAQRDLIDVFARQLALVVEREQLRETSDREKLLAESEKLHRALLDSVSHELRTPLAVITGALETLGTNPPLESAGLIGEMRTAARRLNRLVGNLLDQTRLESGALKPRLDWCDARDLVNAAVEGVRDALAGRPFEVAISDDMPPIRADFGLTEQVLANLLLNASLHTPEGTPIFLAAGIESDGKRAYFTVADRGPGFPLAMSERLFKKFERGDAAKAGGLGLGLSIVRGFVAAQGGEVVLGPNPGGGAVFTVYLPHSAPQSVPPE
jgi:two-component system sensor histidine kinase KdpD